MPSRNVGKRWIWNFRKCECGRCRLCRQREASKRYYHRRKAAMNRNSQLPPSHTPEPRDGSLFNNKKGFYEDI